MILALKITLLVGALILLLRLRIDLALAILLITLLTVGLFQVNLLAAGRAGGAALLHPDTLQLLVIVVAVQYLGAVQKSRKLYDRLIRSLNVAIRDRRLVAMVAPAIIGFLPMPGGALFSAPLVEASLRDSRTKPAFNAFMNFWFRHDWELIWPLYAGLLLFQAMSRIPLKKIILFQAPFSLLHIAAGVAISFLYFRRHGIGRLAPPQPGGESAKNGLGGWFADLLSGTWPLLLVVVLFFTTAIPLYLTLLGVALLLSLVSRVSLREFGRLLFTQTILRSTLVIAAVMVFQEIIRLSAAFDVLKTMHVPLAVMVLFIFLVSFTVGFLTGVNTAYIAIAFPVLLPLIQHQPNYFYLALYIYVIGFAGILCSPLHLCLVLTNEYFGATLLQVYRYLAFPLLMYAITATILVLLL